MVHPSVKAATLQEFLALAKSSKTPLTSLGNGSRSHLVFLVRPNGQDHMTHVPTRRQPGAAGSSNVTLMIIQPELAGAVSRARSAPGGVIEGRSADYPELPTIAEAGLPEIPVGGLVRTDRPKNMPADVLKKISDE